MPTLDDYYRNKAQYNLDDYTTSTPEGDVQAVSYNPGYIEELLALQQRVMSGQGSDWDREWYQQQADAARSVPMRDVSTLQYNAGNEAPDRLSGGSPDVGNIMLTLLDKMQQGTATDQERDLFKTTYTMLADQNWRASVPQASDAFNPLGDNLFGALGTIALGATGGMAAAPLAAGGAGLTTTLGSIGTLAGVAGTAAGAVGQEMDQEWLTRLGLALSATGGITGAVGGLANLASTGINSVRDVASLASNAGRLAGGVGTLSDSDLLRQIGAYLSAGGQAGSGLDTLVNVASGGVNSLTDAGRLASGLQQVTGAAGRVSGNQRLQQIAGLLGLGNRVTGLLGAANQAQNQGRRDDQPDDDTPARNSVLWNLRR